MKVMNLTTLVILVCCLSFLDAGNKECEHPKALGMESGKIADSQITASSRWNVLSNASNARLNFNKYSGSWQPEHKKNQWLQVDFKNKATITEILTQGRGRLDQWVKKYTVSYSNDGKNFEAYKRKAEEQKFKANVNMNSIVTNTLQPAIVARYVRIHPTEYQNHPSMRVEFKGCLKDQAICTIAGDSQIKTFDGKTYNFTGHCEYILANDTGGNFEVLGKNKRCGGGGVTCIYSVIVNLINLKLKIELLRRNVVKVNGENVNLPYNEKGVSIRKQCDGKIGITTPIGLDVEYDGIYNLFIIVYGQYIGKTRGLCDKYYGNKRDDFMKSNRITTTNAQKTSWKVDQDCHDTRFPPSNPCNKDSVKAEKAETLCNGLKRKPFQACNDLVKVKSFINVCEHDCCASKNVDITCLCKAFDAYATECSARGLPIIWKNRHQFKQCDQAICTIAGDPHYRTFDGKTYNFMGHCEYILAEDTGGNFKVLGKNKRCGRGGVYTCVYSVTVKLFMLNLTIELSRGDVVRVNGTNVNLPYNEKGVSIQEQCDGKIGITTPISLDVEYDGIYNVFITVYGRHFDKILGLCGKNNRKKSDNFIMKLNSWKVDQDCDDTRSAPSNPCNKDSAKAKSAEMHCLKLYEKPFKKCNDLVEVEDFIKDCEYDYCGCKNHELTCLCEAFDVYATECSARGLPIIWKNKFPYCENLMKKFLNTVDD